jgi:hypothetical protein
MEGLAYLHWAQAYEDQIAEVQLSQWPTAASRSSKGFNSLALVLLCLLSSIWITGLSSAAQAEDGLYPSSIYAFQEDATSQEGSAVRYTSRYGNYPDWASETGVASAPSSRSRGYSYLTPADSIYAGGYDRYAYIQPESAIPYENAGRDACACTTEEYLPIRPVPNYGNLRFGDSGESVRTLQDLLRNTGYFSGSSTGYFGPTTEEAVIAFQRDYGLLTDGIAGAQTIAALQSLTY